MAPHVDLSKRMPGDPQNRSSRRTFLLYLEACEGGGGETVLLEREAPTIEAAGVRHRVEPRAGRLFFFPHECPHAGAPVRADSPKLALRGEFF
jgi:hypothetical protein